MISQARKNVPRKQEDRVKLEEAHFRPPAEAGQAGDGRQAETAASFSPLYRRVLVGKLSSVSGLDAERAVTFYILLSPAS